MRLKSRLEKPEKFVKVDFHSLFTKCSDAAHFPEDFSNQFLILKTSNYQQKKLREIEVCQFFVVFTDNGRR